MSKREKTSYITRALNSFGVDKNSTEYKLLQAPKEDKKERAHYNFLMNDSIQCDLQFWNPNKKKLSSAEKEKYDLDYDYVTYKYLLVGVNLVSKGVDFSAVSTKSAVDIIEGLDAMLKRPYIGKDIKFIYCDRGSEFINKQFLDWCAKRGITVRSGVVKRYSQHAVVDSFCRIISSVLAIKTTIEQSELNKVNDKANQREWLKYIYKLRSLLNDKEIKVRLIREFFTKSDTKAKLKVGQWVHVKNEAPLDVNDNKHGFAFRTGDYRYEKTPYQIIDIKHTYDNNPPRYIINNHKHATYAAYELLKVNPPKEEKKKKD